MRPLTFTNLPTELLECIVFQCTPQDAFMILRPTCTTFKFIGTLSFCRLLKDRVREWSLEKLPIPYVTVFLDVKYPVYLSTVPWGDEKIARAVALGLLHQPHLPNLDFMLQQACLHGYTRLAETLLESGLCSVWADDGYAVQVSCEQGNLEILKLLMKVDRQYLDWIAKIACEKGRLLVFKWLVLEEGWRFVEWDICKLPHHVDGMRLFSSWWKLGE
ncbi:hypothetical protein BCR33DRAFT_262602 [Rhizoclosmatium globosum]|uniref:F-box domain-containing protein n=1 Tax=Rhizoclosmatium globosum TaxID=329046 RepID=A0A1Y2C8Z7_9FUNG|nr:hypothetical protein BCR33DRAFT_262602 [Rhizoclosmatium globosum]|eukprot:ORY43498.1 hypothetical protein BCR33DRAFT_262602 [Rhizoclosmatium globosum]